MAKVDARDLLDAYRKDLYRIGEELAAITIAGDKVRKSLWALGDRIDKDERTMPRKRRDDGVNNKVDYVKSQGQTRAHHCHWPDCRRQVPPAMWGCREHWYRLPKGLRDLIWATYQQGQEIAGRPSGRYIEAAELVQKWIREFGQ